LRGGSSICCPQVGKRGNGSEKGGSERQSRVACRAGGGRGEKKIAEKEKGVAAVMRRRALMFPKGRVQTKEETSLASAYRGKGKWFPWRRTKNSGGKRGDKSFQKERGAESLLAGSLTFDPKREGNGTKFTLRWFRGDLSRRLTTF